MWVLVTTVFFCRVVGANYPVFDYETRMRILLLPADTRPGTVIYRLRGTDANYDYPLKFDVVDDIGKSIIRVENMPCTPTHTFCQANVYLTRKLEPNRVYDLILSVKDTTGRETKVDSTIKATRATSRFEDIFPYFPTVIMVPENTKLGTILEFVLARKNPQNKRHAYLELWGSENFRIVQNLGSRDVTNGSIILTGALDFEEKTMYMLHIFALDPFTEPREDTRNIAGFQLAIVVEDEQDMPPAFSSVPPVTKLKSNLKVGDKIVQVFAQDGDRGNARPIRYGLVSEKNPYITFFNISEKTGQIVLAKPLRELTAITRSHQPIILTVMAEEVKTKLWEPPAMTATVQVALILEDNTANSPPYFENQQYVVRISENAPQGTAIVFGEPYSTMVKDDDLGKEGVFSLSLENNNGTFEVSPSVGERRVNFVVRVRNNALLDYEKRTSVQFRIVAKELTPSAVSSSLIQNKANVTVYIDDQNDNPPVFAQTRYESILAENVTAGTVVTQVQATDLDSGIFGKVFYTNIIGNPNQSLSIDSVSGLITVITNHHGFDRESAQEYKLTVEARDMEGVGNRATVPLIIKLLDVNDETPEFERQVFEFILQPSLRNFTSRAFVKAIDKDAEPPNNIVRYEIMSGNYENKFHLNEITGELAIRGRLSKRRPDRAKRQSDYEGDDYLNPRHQGREEYDNEDGIDSVIVLKIRAYDLGIPHRWQHAYVRIYPPESRARNMNFIVSGSNPDRRRIEALLRQLTGGRVIIQEIKPYTGRESGTDLSWKDNNGQSDKSVVVATIFYDGNSYVDIDQLEARLTANKTQAIVDASVTGYRKENQVLFWIMIFLLILLMLVVIMLILCCIWQGCCACPGIVIDRKRVVSPSENVKFIIHERGKGLETKGVQAGIYSARKEAWSAKNEERAYHYPKRNGRERLVRQMHVEGGEDITAAAATYRSHADDENGGPNIIYTREFIKKERDRQPPMLVEDVEIDPYPAETIPLKKNDDIRKEHDVKLRIHHENDPDSDSMRRHEVERGSDLGKSLRKSDFERLQNQKAEVKPDYQRIEIDRGIEVGPSGVKEYRLVLERPQRRSEEASDDEIIDLDQDITNREQYYIRDGNAEILRLVTRGNQEERPRTLVPENEKTFVKLDKGKEIIMKRFMEDQKQTLTDNTDELQQEILRRLQREYQERNMNPQFLNRSDFFRKLDDAAIQEYVTHLLTSQNREGTFASEGNANFDMDNRTMAYSMPNQDTQSLPGHVEMSTQTERECGTQTEELSMLRPPRRKVRSDNEFSDEDIEEEQYNNLDKAVTALNLGKGWVKRGAKNGKNKKTRRYKIKTPILEEAESANESGIKYDTRPAMFKMPEYELIVNGTGPGAYTENKSSILRRRKLKEKIAEEGNKSDDDTFSDYQKKENESTGDESIIEIKPHKSRKSRRDSMEERKGSPKKIAKINEVRKRRAESLNRLYSAVKELEDQELETIRLETRQRTVSLNRLYNALAELEEDERNSESLKKARSLGNLNKVKINEREKSFHSLDNGNHQDYLRRAGFYKKIKDLSSTTESSQSKQQESTETSWEELRNKKNLKNKTSEEDSARKYGSEKSQESEKLRIRESTSEPPKETTKDSVKDSTNVSTFGSAEDIHKASRQKRSKYMDWYKNLNGKREPRKKEEDAKDTKESKEAKDGGKKEGKKEDDLDSGIAMSSLLSRKPGGRIPVRKKNQQLLEKKSVFTIAYDEMQTKNIRPDTNSSQRL